MNVTRKCTAVAYTLTVNFLNIYCGIECLSTPKSAKNIVPSGFKSKILLKHIHTTEVKEGGKLNRN
jgi:hypothetical protein